MMGLILWRHKHGSTELLDLFIVYTCVLKEMIYCFFSLGTVQA